jgi:hypothetical protein
VGYPSDLGHFTMFILNESSWVVCIQYDLVILNG